MVDPEHYGQIELAWEAAVFTNHRLDAHMGRVVLHGARVIVGIESDQGRLTAHNCTPLDPNIPQEPENVIRGSTSLELPKTTIENLHDFYATFHANKPPATYFDCHTTAQVLAGHETEHVQIDTRKYVFTPLRSPNGPLERGVMYTMQTGQEPNVQTFHTVLGIGVPKRCLSTLGKWGPLVIAFTPDVMRFFGATGLQRMDRLG